MSKASKRRQAAQRAAPPPPQAGPSGQLLAGLGVALVVVVVVVLVAGGGLGQVSPSGAKPAATAAPAGLNAAEVKLLEDAIKANPANMSAMISLGNLYYDAQQFAQSIPWYAKALELAPNDTNVRTDMATAYYYSGDTNRAIEEGRKVLAIDPNKIQTRLNMGIWLTSLTPPNVAEAIQHWQVVANLYPGSDTAKQAQTLIDKYKGQLPAPAGPVGGTR